MIIFTLDPKNLAGECGTTHHSPHNLLYLFFIFFNPIVYFVTCEKKWREANKIILSKKKNNISQCFIVVEGAQPRGERKCRLQMIS